ncbi:WXG100 family type VII secretion target [Aldersonia sp. NBC_00410]|jgi:WXG100 family type VII secretion target|uniref:WXG100 family type VII secretion target n=1 Tax=Aldersonia sp. NBC_00410 TaxID=2975954 RepID=UPI00225754AC|nr:WXG100 family type VII secretion target [Aldersonia sp. NBC_00410]MCX5045077.1 WXG100 family type VII secretion target [Aldersonia sp. NBC_00410]
MTSKFEFDLDEIDRVTSAVRGFGGFVTDLLESLDARVAQLIQEGKWSGYAADAYADEHRDWAVAVREIVDGLTDMETAARNAHESYSTAMEANRRMTEG